MNPIFKPHTRNDNDLTISSLTTYFDRLQMNPINSDGSINLLPNEIIQLIFTKLQLDCDVKKLIRLRLVSTRWRALVEDYCARKKSLIVVINQTEMNIQTEMRFSSLKKRFFGFANLQEFTLLVLNTKMSSTCLRTLFNLFPNIFQLSIRCYEPFQDSELVEYINSLDSLKQLDLVGPFVPALSSLSPTLSKLEHFSSFASKKNDNHHLLVSHLGQNCTRVYFERFAPFVYRQIRQWHSINRAWLANLTHLHICISQCEIFASEDCAQVVHFLSEHATCLKHLNFAAWSLPFELTLSVIDSFGKLTHLTELVLWNVQIDFSVLDQAAAQQQLTSIISVSSLKLYIILSNDHCPISGDQFTRVLSVIFPNLVNLEHTIAGKCSTEPKFQHEMEQLLVRFPKLYKHDIDFVDFKN